MGSSYLIVGGSIQNRRTAFENLLKKDGEMKKVLSPDSPDYQEISPQKEKKSIGISQTKEALKFMNERPFELKQKILFFPNAELLTPDAQNSLLKLLEEPPAYALVGLSCEKERDLFPTVVSRCKKIVIQNQAVDTFTDTFNKLMKKTLGERLAWAEEFSKEDKSLILETLKSWIVELRNNLLTSRNPEKQRVFADAIVEIQKVLDDLESTNLNQRLAIETLLLNIPKIV